MLRILGGAICLISSLAAYGYFVSAERRKIETLKDIISLIRYIRDRVDCYSAPIDKILESCDRDLLSRLGVNKNVTSIGEILPLLKGEIDGECEKILQSFSDSFGKGYREGQVVLCDGALRSLEERCDRMKATYPNRKKVAATLTLVADGIIFIVLL